MGIYIHLNVSNKVDSKQWEKAYEESLILIDKIGLVEYDEIKKFGRKIWCLAPSRERNVNGRLGWLAHGDAYTLKTAEDQFFPRKISASCDSEEYADPLMYVLAQHCIENFENPFVQKVTEFFGNKTQGEPYHMVLLCIGCLFDDRLNGEAICSGDITYGQCEHAIQVANKYLKKPIKTPLRCDLNRLYERVCKLPIAKEKLLLAFETTYLGPKNEEYFNFVKEKFSDEAKGDFVRECLKGNRLGTYGFSKSIQRILAYPIAIADVCREFVALHPEEMTAKDETRNPYELFIEDILETNIHIPVKDLRNCLDADEGSGEVMSIEKLFAGFCFMGARNKNVNRFVPLDELKREIVSVIGDKCDVEKVVEAYVKKHEENKSSVSSELNDIHEKFQKKEDKTAKIMETYDIARYRDLPFYEKGNSVWPKLQEQIKSWVDFYKGALKEDYYAEISKKDFEAKFKYFALQNKCLHLWKESWEKILKDVEENPESFERYYPMVRVSINSEDAQGFVRAYVENDEFYEFCQTL